MPKYSKFFTLLLRLLAFAATTSAAIVMVTSHDSAKVLNLTFKAKYSNTPAFTCYVIVEAIASGYSLIILSLFQYQLTSPLGHYPRCVLLSSSVSAALAIADVGKKGNSHAGWLPICGPVPKFCDQVTRSLVAGFIATVLYLVLLLYSLYAALDPLLL